VELGRD
jgi:hypothetical protein